VTEAEAPVRRNDIGLGDWIRTQRLEACRADLRSPRWQHLTIASVARRSGLTDASSLGRMFRAAYERLSPPMASTRGYAELRSAPVHTATPIAICADRAAIVPSLMATAIDLRDP